MDISEMCTILKKCKSDVIPQRLSEEEISEVAPYIIDGAEMARREKEYKEYLESGATEDIMIMVALSGRCKQCNCHSDSLNIRNVCVSCCRNNYKKK